MAGYYPHCRIQNQTILSRPEKNAQTPLRQIKLASRLSRGFPCADKTGTPIWRVFLFRNQMNDTYKPFLQKNLPPNWKAMDASKAESDIESAIAEAEENLNAIRNTPDEDLTYLNCVRALDRASDTLDQAWTYINHLQSVADSKPLREVLNKLLPRVSDFYSAVELDGELFAKVRAFSESAEAGALTGSAKKLLSETILDFELSGANLPADKKARLTEISSELALKTQKFSENVLDDTKRYILHVEKESDLAGLPQNAVDVARKQAKSRGLSGWVFTLDQPSYSPFISYAENDKLREEIWRASARIAADGEFSNMALVREILSLRAEEAEILGRANFADVVLERRMARTGKAALAFVEKLKGRFADGFEREWKALLGFARTGGELDENGKMPPWRSAYVSEKLRRKKYDFDPESLRPYFPMDDVKAGLFKICETLYGLKIEKLPEVGGVWDDTVELYKISDSRGGVLGLFYTDFIPRKNKRSGAWMNLLAHADAERGLPNLGVIAGNLSEPSEGAPALLSHDDVETLFHEFGHLIHFFMMDCPEVGLRDVAWDFVELPSQIMENWCRDKQCLDIFARHWKTGEKIPEELFEKFRRASKFMGANSSMRQLSFAKLDLALHIDPYKFVKASDLQAAARSELKGYVQEFSENPPTLLPRFTHLFGDAVGYAAGYYSYKWAEVLDADAFTRFEAEGVLNSATGADFAEKILRVGSTIDPAEAFRNFMGRDPDMEALVRRSVE